MDIGERGNHSDNSYHVITFKGTCVGAAVDGFTIMGGNANGTENADRRGGGLYSVSSNPIVTNCTFVGNSAAESGGAIWSSDKWYVLTFTNCVFSGNSAEQGGALHVESLARMTNCTLAGNQAGRGGAISTQNEGHAHLSTASSGATAHPKGARSGTVTPAP